MLGYAVRRILLIIPTIFLVTVIVFMAVRLIPGDVIDNMLATMEEESDLGSVDREYLERIIDRYPDSSYARRAKLKLKDL